MNKKAYTAITEKQSKAACDNVMNIQTMQKVTPSSPLDQSLAMTAMLVKTLAARFPTRDIILPATCKDQNERV
jgi:hypothetical protein